MKNDWARFWAIDFHVHTPGSQDAKAEHYGTADDIVEAAIAAGLDAIAITDHNTAAWCEQVVAAASATQLVVLPGVEISTTEGHLLAIWEEDTSHVVIEELLVRLGIGQADRGKLDIAANVGLAAAAHEVDGAGGIAILAHVDRPKGLLKIDVKAHLDRTLLDEHVSGIEVAHLDTIEEVTRRVPDDHVLAFVRGSDTWDKDLSCHSLAGIGARRTWIKASRPDLVGIRHALADPALRISLEEPPQTPHYARIDSIEMLGGFLGGEKVELSPDLNCLLGGTGAGKSLVLEAVRFGLEQQADRTAFPAIRAEIDSRMRSALMNGSIVRLLITANGERYKVERTYDPSGSGRAQIFQHINGDWAELDAQPAALCQLAAFSQGEILEYSREPVGRMALVDSSLDLQVVDSEIRTVCQDLRQNAGEVVRAHARAQALAEEANQVPELAEHVRKLAELFDSATVKEQAGWTAEKNDLARATSQIAALKSPALVLPNADVVQRIDSNRDLFTQVVVVLGDLRTGVNAGLASVAAAVDKAAVEVATAQKSWSVRFADYKTKLEKRLHEAGPDGASLASLRVSLQSRQEKLAGAEAARKELEATARPRLVALEADREVLIERLHAARKERRRLRRARVSDLNSKAAGLVKLDVPNEGDAQDFRVALDRIKVGSRVRDDVLNMLAVKTHPLKFVRAMWSRDLSQIADPQNGIDGANLAKLLANIDDRDLWEELLEMQTIDRPDVLTIKFKKPDDHQYTPIEELAHGQRCTAILVVLLVDGDMPVLVDQPEDALHAPWIEDYLVDRLRSLRGSRQYLFATRSPGIVVSADAEQIITMKATAGHGGIEASGSLERHELNRLVLDHLEGGPLPFLRRTSKLQASVKHGPR